MDCPRYEENMKNCNCTYSCDKKGQCCLCVAYHRSMGELPACYFSNAAEATYDRTVEKYLEDRGNRR